MQRNSHRRQAGSRRNKHHTVVVRQRRRADRFMSERMDAPWHRRWHRHAWRCAYVQRELKCNCNPLEHGSKPNHRARTVRMFRGILG